MKRNFTQGEIISLESRFPGIGSTNLQVHKK